MTDKGKNILQAYNLGFIETHHHSKAIAYVLKELTQNINLTSDRTPTQEWSKGFVVGLSSAKQEIFRIAEELEQDGVI